MVKPKRQKRMTEAVRKINGRAAEGMSWDSAGKLVGIVYESKAGTPFVALVGNGGHEFPAETTKLIVKFFQQHEQN